MLHSLRKFRGFASRPAPIAGRLAMRLGGQSGRVSGRLVIPLLFGGTLLLAGAVFLVGNMEKRRWDHVSLSSPGPGDRVLAEPESIRVYLGSLPTRWVQMTRVGDKFAVITPCFSETPSLVWEWTDASASGRLRVLCPFCENADTLPVGSLQLPRLGLGTVSSGAGMTLHFQNDTLPLWVHNPMNDPVNRSVPGQVSASANVSANTPAYASAPTQENPPFPDLKAPTLRWIRGADTLWFLPQDSLALVEIQSEADENPEGCRPDENEEQIPEDKDFIESDGASPSP